MTQGYKPMIFPVLHNFLTRFCLKTIAPLPPLPQQPPSGDGLVLGKSCGV